MEVPANAQTEIMHHPLSVCSASSAGAGIIALEKIRE